MNSQTERLVLRGPDGKIEALRDQPDAGRAPRGVAVVGFNSLKYFWKEKTPEDTAADLARVVQHYSEAWNRHRVMLIGYSFGAGLLPFLTFYAITGYLIGSTLGVSLSVAAAYGFTTLAMLIPAVSAFDVALGRSTADRG